MFAGFIQIYEKIIRAGRNLQSPFLLLVRLYWGGSFFLTGMAKWHNIDPIVLYFQSLHIPFPALSAHLAAMTECIGGACLLAGLASRLVSIPLILTMVVAYLTAEIDSVKMLFSNPGAFTSRTPFLYLMAAFLIFVFGPGIFSFDHLLKKIFAQKEN